MQETRHDYGAMLKWFKVHDDQTASPHLYVHFTHKCVLSRACGLQYFQTFPTVTFTCGKHWSQWFII